MKIIVSAGGTGGHIYPALAIIEEFKKQEKDLEVLYIGTHNRMEKDIIPEHGIKYEPITIYGFSKTMIKRDIKNIGYIVSSYNKCVNIMKEFKPDVVIGVGGYVTFPVIMAAKKMHIKTVIHEQNSIPGKANKFLSASVDLILTSFKDSNKYFKNKHVVYTGNPSGDNVKNLKSIDPCSYGLDKNKKKVLITCGSLGSSGLNSKLIDYLNDIKDYEVLFVTGKNNYDDMKKAINNKNVFLTPYIDNQAGILKNMDLIISRAGASTLAEIVESLVPSLIIPSPYVSNNHQYYNALSLSEIGCVKMIEEKDLTKEMLESSVEELLNNNMLRAQMKNNLRKNMISNSSNIIYKEIKKIV